MARVPNKVASNTEVGFLSGALLPAVRNWGPASIPNLIPPIPSAEDTIEQPDDKAGSSSVRVNFQGVYKEPVANHLNPILINQ